MLIDICTCYLYICVFIHVCCTICLKYAAAAAAADDDDDDDGDDDADDTACIDSLLRKAFRRAFCCQIFSIDDRILL